MTTMRLAEEVGQGRARRAVKPTYGYYRQNNGWITVSPATDLDELRYRRDGWEPLRRYGYLEMSGEWVADHPLEFLFMQGGAKELSLQQILESGFAIKAPTIPTCGTALGAGHNRHNGTCWEGAREVVFPQLAGLTAAEIGPFPCHFCERQLPTVKAQQQHEKVAHGPEKSDTRTGEALANALVEGFKGQAPGNGTTNNDAVVAELLGQIMAMREELAAMKAGKRN